MALFGLKKNKENKIADEKAVVKAKSIKTSTSSATKTGGKKTVKKDKEQNISNAKTVATIDASNENQGIAHGAGAIIRPRVTEKSGYLSQIGVYTFEVNKDATKLSINHAINTLYKVNPIKVAIINLPNRKVVIKGRRGEVAGIRKALVTLKKGDKIDFV